MNEHKQTMDEAYEAFCAGNYEKSAQMYGEIERKSEKQRNSIVAHNRIVSTCLSSNLKNLPSVLSQLDHLIVESQKQIGESKDSTDEHEIILTLSYPIMIYNKALALYFLGQYEDTLALLLSDPIRDPSRFPDSFGFHIRFLKIATYLSLSENVISQHKKSKWIVDCDNEFSVLEADLTAGKLPMDVQFRTKLSKAKKEIVTGSNLSKKVITLAVELFSKMESAAPASSSCGLIGWLPRDIKFSDSTTFLRAHKEYLKGNPKKALKMVRMISESLPLHILHTSLGCIYFKLQKYGLAIYFFQLAYREFPIAPPPCLIYNMACSFLENRDYDIAYYYFQKSEIMEPYTWLRIADCCLQTGMNPSLSIVQSTFITSKQYTYFPNMNQYDSSPEKSLLSIANYCLERCLTAIEESVDEKEKSELLGLCYLRLIYVSLCRGDKANAQEYIKLALALRDLSQEQLNLLWTYQLEATSGGSRKEIPLSDELIKRSSEGNDPFRSELLLNLSLAALEAGNAQKARQYCLSVIAKEPRNAFAMRVLLKIYLREKKIPAALSLIHLQQYADPS